MFKKFFFFCVSLSCAVNAMDQKAFNRSVRDYSTAIMSGAEIDTNALKFGLQFLVAGEVDPLKKVLAEQTVFENIYKQAESCSKMKQFAELCNLEFNVANELGKIQIAMVLQAVFNSCAAASASLGKAPSGLDKLFTTSSFYTTD